MSKPNLPAAPRRNGTLRRAFAQRLIDAMQPPFAAAPLKPLSPRERGWGEGPSAHGAPNP